MVVVRYLLHLEQLTMLIVITEEIIVAVSGNGKRHRNNPTDRNMINSVWRCVTCCRPL